MKPILAIDLDGALMYSRPFDDAHKEWFRVMSVLLKDESIRKYAELENWWPKVHEVMTRYLGDATEEARVLFARNLYGKAIVALTQVSDVFQEFADYLHELKGRYVLALITTTPGGSVESILRKINCSDLFDIVYESPMNREQDKKKLFQEFVKEYGEIKFYIGNGDKDLGVCKELGIKTISVNWVKKAEIKGDYDVKEVKELNEIFQNQKE